jgi:catechol 2,3-dioxygenase-like lactoylglutathione lyase family enzyme
MPTPFRRTTGRTELVVTRLIVVTAQRRHERTRSRGAVFLTPPHDWRTEIRCFLRDPDGHLLEISQAKASSGA